MPLSSPPPVLFFHTGIFLVRFVRLGLIFRPVGRKNVFCFFCNNKRGGKREVIKCRSYFEGNTGRGKGLLQWNRDAGLQNSYPEQPYYSVY